MMRTVDGQLRKRTGCCSAYLGGVLFCLPLESLTVGAVLIGLPECQDSRELRISSAYNGSDQWVIGVGSDEKVIYGEEDCSDV